MTRVLLVLVALLAAGCADLLPVEEGRPPATERVAPEGGLEVLFVDVGQGDGTIWRFPDGSLVVYDCGEAFGEDAFSPIVAQLRALGATRIHTMIVSHGHADHAGGCAAVMDAFVVERVVDGWYDGADATRTYRAFRDAVLREGAALFTLRDAPNATRIRAGDALPLPQAAGARADLLWPLQPVATSWDDVERESLVVRLAYGDVSFCFQGDITPREEAQLARSERAPACDVVLAGHHGSRGASTTPWLERLDPEHAVVSFGENPYGHPTSEALCRLQQAGARLWFTHRLGAVAFRTDGRTVEAPPGAETQDWCAEGASYW